MSTEIKAMNTDIVEGNKLIAEFMGWTSSKSSDAGILGGSITYWKNPDTGSVGYFHPDKYHTSWAWLMPVVEKISLIPFPKENGWSEEDYKDFSAYPYPRTFGMRNAKGKFMVRLNANQLFEADTLIEATWLAVVDFIKWYNQNKQS